MSHVSADEELVAACKRFRSTLNEWMTQINALGVEEYVEGSDTGQTLRALRAEWGNSLEQLCGLPPCTLFGAREKLSAAQAFLTFVCEADGSAIEFMALATRELDQVSTRDHSSVEMPSSRRAVAPPFCWIKRLAQRV